MSTELDDALIKTLQRFDTPTVCNALELLIPERRGYGFTTSQLVCTRPELPPIIGYARTATIRAAHPSDLSGKEARALSDSYYEYIDRGPKPSIAVIQDLDGNNGYGCLWGEVNSNIHMGFGCQGVITDGGVRDVPDIAPGFQMLAASVLPSHAFVHVVDYSRPVDVAGMRGHRWRHHSRRPTWCGGDSSRGHWSGASSGRTVGAARSRDHFSSAETRL